MELQGGQGLFAMIRGSLYNDPLQDGNQISNVFPIQGRSLIGDQDNQLDVICVGDSLLMNSDKPQETICERSH